MVLHQRLIQFRINLLGLVVGEGSEGGGGIILNKIVAFLLPQSNDILAVFFFFLAACHMKAVTKVCVYVYFFRLSCNANFGDFCWLTCSDMPPQICHILFLKPRNQCVCVCVCERERERDTHTHEVLPHHIKFYIHVHW